MEVQLLALQVVRVLMEAVEERIEELRSLQSGQLLSVMTL